MCAADERAVQGAGKRSICQNKAGVPRVSFSRNLEFPISISAQSKREDVKCGFDEMRVLLGNAPVFFFWEIKKTLSVFFLHPL